MYACVCVQGGLREETLSKALKDVYRWWLAQNDPVYRIRSGIL